MLGLMMRTPLLLSSILTYAARAFPDVEIVSRTPDMAPIRNVARVLSAAARTAN